MFVQAGSPTRTAYVDVTLIRSKVKVKVTDHLNFLQLAMPCMLAAMTAAPLRGFLVWFSVLRSSFNASYSLFHISQFLKLCLGIIFGRPLLTDTVYPMSVLFVCPVCNVGVLWPNDSTDQDETGMHLGLGSGHIVLDAHPAALPKRGTAPNFRPISVVAKWLDGSRCHLIRR